jgi:hypothetical protein
MFSRLTLFARDSSAGTNMTLLANSSAITSSASLFDSLRARATDLNWASVTENLATPMMILRTVMVNVPLALLNFAMNASKFILDCFFSLMVFLSALYLFLVGSGNQAEDTYAPIAFVIALVPTTMRRKTVTTNAAVASTDGALDKDVARMITDSITLAVSDVFTSSIQTAHFHFLSCWLLHSACGSDIVFIPALVCSLLAVVPALPSFLAVVPLAAYLYFVADRVVAAIVVLSVQIAAWTIVVPAIQADIKMVDPYITALSILGGFTAFGLTGVLVGPLLVCVLAVGHKILVTVGAHTHSEGTP